MANVVYTCQQLGEIGRLGNQLFQAAGTLHRAMTGRRAAIASLHPDWPYRKYFSIPDGCFKPPAEHVGSRPVDCEGYMQDKLMVALVCGVNRDDEEGCVMVPFAVMCEGNPFDDFYDPTL